MLESLAQERADDEAALGDAINLICQAFMGDNLPDGAVRGQVCSGAKRVALVAAAGELAAGYGVLPWKEGEATSAAQSCFAAWLDNRGSSGAAEDTKAIDQVRVFIEEHGDSRFSRIGEHGEPEHNRTNNRAGFHRIVDGPEGDRLEYLILSRVWSKTVCKGLNPARAAKSLLEAGYLIPAKNGQYTHVMKVQKGLPAVRGYLISGEIMGGAA